MTSAILTLGLLTASISQGVAMQMEIDSIVKWLPADTETLVIIKPQGFGAERKAEVYGGPPRQWMGAPVPTDNIKQLIPPRFVVHGARGFKEPNGIGAGNYESVEVNSYTPKDMTKVTDYLKKKVKKTATLNGQTAYVKTESYHDNKSTVYYIISENKVISTTSKKFLSEYQDHKSTSIKRFAPEQSASWVKLKKDAPFLAFRKVSDRGRVRGNGLNFDDTQWKEFAVNIFSDHSIVAYHVSDNRSIMPTLQKNWNNPQLNSSLFPVTSRMTEIRISPKEWTTSSPIYFITIALGYAIFV